MSHHCLGRVQSHLPSSGHPVTEVVFLRRLRHPHLVQFVGYCTEQQQALLVYELMANSSLDYHLFDGELTCLTTTSVCVWVAWYRVQRQQALLVYELMANASLDDHLFDSKLPCLPVLVACLSSACEGLYAGGWVGGWVGYCTEKQQVLLVYELMAYASLDYHLFDAKLPCLSGAFIYLMKLRRLRGHLFLSGQLQRRLKIPPCSTSHISAVHNFKAKLSDFGLAKDGPAGENTHVSTMVVGTYGYTAPEYLQTGHLTAKSDVYAFGVVLLELLSGRRAVDIDRPGDEKNLVFWAKPFLADRKRIGEIVDPRLEGRFSHKGALKLAVAAHCCLQDAKSRPSMADMVQTLTALMEMGEGASGGSGRGGDTPRTPRTPRTPKTPKTPKALKTTNTLKPLGSAGGDADTPAASLTASGVSGDGAITARADARVGGDADTPVASQTASRRTPSAVSGDAGINTVGGSDGVSSGGAAAAAD
ncbi:unnamed protein product, partial [Closterium sp. NIES-53]